MGWRQEASAAEGNVIEPDTPDAENAFDYNVYALAHLPEYDGYVGKRVLIILTYLDSTGAVKDRVQRHGIITRINEAVIAVNLQDTGEEFTLPADLSALRVAAGEYRLKPSGEIVVNPDYLAVWTITEPDEDGAIQTF